MAYDGIDERILELLKEDARRPYVEIARELSTSEGTIRARVKKLVEAGTIRSFTVRTAGRGVKAMIEVKLAANVRTARISAEVAKWPGVESVWEVSGEDDILALVDVGTTDDLNEVVERVRGFPEVSGTRSRLIFKEL